MMRCWLVWPSRIRIRIRNCSHLCILQRSHSYDYGHNQEHDYGRARCHCLSRHETKTSSFPGQRMRCGRRLHTSREAPAPALSTSGSPNVSARQQPALAELLRPLTAADALLGRSFARATGSAPSLCLGTTHQSPFDLHSQSRIPRSLRTLEPRIRCIRRHLRRTNLPPQPS